MALKEIVEELESEIYSDVEAYQPVPVGEYAYIPRGTIHRLCGGENGIKLIEVQRGICEEDDIVRIEDDYGRLEK